MVVGGSQQETLHPCLMLLGTRQEIVPVILRELMGHGSIYPVPTSYTVRDSPRGVDNGTSQVDRFKFYQNVG
ncbi:unnamed protein product [Schistosoma margrebowiei]|uniref:Uncharacterized protein n=1 Tax=Schistosoma margrebowiei TaxID=48269 RepID=A0A183NAW7_9TREM|nr:unnamed protein product [Schistosoma margrebowiei]